MMPMSKTKIVRNKALRDKALDEMHNFDVDSDPGKYFEHAMAVLVRLYAEEAANDKFQIRQSAGWDYLEGTDLIIDDPTRSIMSRRITRLDFTIGLTGKNTMPLVTPTESMSLLNEDKRRGIVHNRGLLPLSQSSDSLRFGVRVGNGSYCFDQPVIVCGISTSHELDTHRIRDNVIWLHNNIIDNAPAVMRAANNVMARFMYMTDPKYKAAIDAKNSPDVIRKHLPVLVGNWAFLDQQITMLHNHPELSEQRMCRSNVVNANAELELDDFDKPITRYSNIPWKSQSAHDAFTAMLNGPRKMPDSAARQKILHKLLSYQIRDAKQGPAIIIDKSGRPLDKAESKPALLELVKHLNKKFNNPDTTGPDY